MQTTQRKETRKSIKVIYKAEFIELKKKEKNVSKLNVA